MKLDQSTRKIAYEWVLIMNKGDDIILTEKQFQVFKENITETKIVFSDCGFSPAFVVQWYKRPASTWILNKYPCMKCRATGRSKDSGWCIACGGSGVNISLTNINEESK